ncbi:MAG TPA: hypothetical protein VMB79_12335 [Jatrophihabitans sp.]|nr:hypothetical protein [Jatrophihabitans sp.]
MAEPPPYPPYGQPTYGQPPYGQPPYGQMPAYGQPPDPFYGQFAPKPGCIPLRPLAVGEIIGGAFAATRRNARVVLTLSALVAVLQALAGIWFGLSGGASGGGYHPGSGASLAGVLIGAVAASMLSGGLIVVVTEDVVGRRAGFALVWRKVRSRFWRLVAVSLITSVLEFVGLVLFVAPGVWLWGIWAVAVPALMIENPGIGGALRRSRELARGMFWRVWGVRALGYLVSFGVSFAVSLVFGVLTIAVAGSQVQSQFQFGSGGYHPVALPTSALILIEIGSAIGAFLSAPIKAGVDSLLYVDQRMRREGLAQDLQQAAATMRRD